jgi:hypothetical protein
VVAREQLAPTLVTQLRGPFRRSDDVREQHRGEDPVGVWSAAHPRQELLYLVQDLVLVADPRKVIVAG